MSLEFLFKGLAYVGTTIRAILNSFSNVIWMLVAIAAFAKFKDSIEFEIPNIEIINQFALTFMSNMGWILISLFILFLYLGFTELKNLKKEGNKR